MNTNFPITRSSGSDSDFNEADYMNIAQEVFAFALSQQERIQNELNCDDRTFLIAIHNQDMASTEENDYEAFVTAGEVQSTGDLMDIEFESDYIESNKYRSKNYDSDSSNDYSPSKKKNQKLK
ncbi:hypothetical protein F4703DRAFT_1798687 [Phycomyces blakesleeanus]